ncbi:hypothetical protein VRK_38560 [Vibrio sp. MEBiC08052]|nr:hypothetical protein VRK_38560 [Vibrio sp. MEBiC08052]
MMEVEVSHFIVHLKRTVCEYLSILHLILLAATIRAIR